MAKEKDTILFNPEMRRIAKAANQRIRELERRAPHSPALGSVQAKLEAMGVKRSGDKGRRFSETGKGTVKQMHDVMKVLKEFMRQTTSTATGTKRMMKRAYETANEKYNLKSHGVSQEDYFKIWANRSDAGVNNFSSDFYIEVVEKVNDMNGKRKREDRIPIEDIVKQINESKDQKEALKSLGINEWEDYDDDLFFD